MLAFPGKPTSATKAKASEVLGNLEGLDVRVNSIEDVIDNIVTDPQTYGNGVFPDGLVASEVSTQLQYSSGSFIVNHLFYTKTSLSVDLLGYGADTYYIEVDNAGGIDIYTSTDPNRANLNTVVWNGAGFDSISTADRNVLATYQEVIDARNAFDSLDNRLDDMDTNIGLNTAHKNGDGSDHADVSTNTSDISNIEDGTTPIVEKVTNQTTAALTLDSTHRLIVCDTTSNAITLTLPDAGTVIGQVYDVYAKTVTSSNDVTIACAAGDTLNLAGNNRITLTEEDFVQIVAIDANRWYLRINHNAVLFTV